MSDPSASHACARCLAPMPDAPDGLCPRCLMAEAMQPTQAGDLVAAIPPLTPEELAPHFPQLEILACLGRGGMGVVYKARQKSLNRLVALKLLAPERADDPQFAARFEKEAHALAALNHPNIVGVYDFGVTQTLLSEAPTYFLLMEFVYGVNLRQLLQTKRLTPKEALSIVPPICEALQCAHDHGIVHRDIKPENLLIDKAGTVKIADFGIAKMYSSPLAPREEPCAAADTPDNRTSAAPRSGDSAQLISQSEMATMGTPDYAAPEQYDSTSTTDHRADIYSLGVVLYEMLTGERPQQDFVPPSKRVQVDVRIDEIVLRALEKTPELRFATAAEFRTQVEAATQPPSEPVSQTLALHHLMAWLVLGCAVLSALIPLLFYWLRPVLAPWLTLDGVGLMLWLALFFAVAAVMGGYSLRGTPIGRKARIMGSISLTIWVLFDIAAHFAGHGKPMIRLWSQNTAGSDPKRTSTPPSRPVDYVSLITDPTPTDEPAYRFGSWKEAVLHNSSSEGRPHFNFASGKILVIKEPSAFLGETIQQARERLKSTGGDMCLEIEGGITIKWHQCRSIGRLPATLLDDRDSLKWVSSIASGPADMFETVRPHAKGGGLMIRTQNDDVVFMHVVDTVEEPDGRQGIKFRYKIGQPIIAEESLEKDVGQIIPPGTSKESRVALQYMDPMTALNRIKSEQPELAGGIRRVETEGNSLVLDASSPSYPTLQRYLASVDHPPETITLEGTVTEALPNSPEGSEKVISKPKVQTILGVPAIFWVVAKDGLQIEFSIKANKKRGTGATAVDETFVLDGTVTESLRSAPAGARKVFTLPTLQAPLFGSATFTHRLQDGRDVELSVKLTHSPLSPQPKVPVATTPLVTKQHAEKPQNDVPFKGAPKLHYIAWMPKDESGWQLSTPDGEAVTAPGDIPVADWEWWKTGLLSNRNVSKISDTSGWLMFFYSHPAIDQRSESRLSLFTPEGAEIHVTQRVAAAREPKTPQADGWFATGCRVPYAAVKGSLKARLALTAGSWWQSEPVAAGKTNDSAGGQFLTNSGEDANHRAFVTVVTEDEDKFPYYQWEVLGRLRDGSDVRSEGGTTVSFQSQYVHTISFGQPLSSYVGFIIRSRERKNFINDGVQLPRVLIATPESAIKSTFQVRWVQGKSSSETEPIPVAAKAQSETLNVEKTILLDQSALKSVRSIHRSGGSQIELQMNASGTQRLADLTREGKGRRLAIVIDGKVHAAPLIMEEIGDGRVEISGNLTYEEADDLAARLQQTIESTSPLKSSNDQAETNAQRQVPAASTANYVFGPIKGRVLSAATDRVAPNFQFTGGKTVMIRLAPTASIEEIGADRERANAAGGVDFTLRHEAGDFLIRQNGCAFGAWPQRARCLSSRPLKPWPWQVN